MGFKYSVAPKITLKSLAVGGNVPEIVLYDKPTIDPSKTRVTGPFTVESIPALFVKNLDQAVDEQQQEEATASPDVSVVHQGETLRQEQWRDELARTGVRAKNGNLLEFSRIEAQAGTRYIQAIGETKEENPQKVLIVFGPEHAPMDARTVELALEEAKYIKPHILLFCAFQFDEEASKDIEEAPESLIGFKLLKAQMNMDLQTDDLKKKRNTNQSFWLIGQPDVRVVSEEWLVGSGQKKLCAYENFKIVSGLDRLAEINQLNPADLYLYAALSERRDLWAGFTNAKGQRLDSQQHSGGAGSSQHGGIPAISGDFQRVISGIGDAIGNIKATQFSGGGSLPEVIKRLRGDQQIAQWLDQITKKPLSTSHSSLTTHQYTTVEVKGFDYYNPKTGAVDSGGAKNIAMWLLDPDYDGRSLFPRQVFFPMAGADEGWAKLGKSLKAEIDEEKLEAFRGTKSLPFKAGKQIAIKIIDDRGIESLKIIKR